MRSASWVGALLAFCGTAAASLPAHGKNPNRLSVKNDAKPWNILFLAVDDLRPQIDCLDAPGTVRPTGGMHTPSLCALASKSLVLERSQVVMATCSPSRTGLLTGRHPSATHVWDLYSYFRNVTGNNFTTIPQYFKENGYTTQGFGKIFHPGTASGGQVGHKCPLCRGSDDANYSWSEPFFHCDDPASGGGPADPDNDAWVAVPKNVTDAHPLCDTQVLQAAQQAFPAMEKAYHEEGKNFFLAVGFHKPHLPFVFPESYLDYYPEDSIQLPPNQFAPWDMPDVAWQSYGETRSYTDIAALHATGDINTTLPPNVVKDLRRGYYSAVSYTDDNIGALLDTLDQSSVANSTIVLFWGDHGWHLGEHGLWDKHTNFDLNTHAPAMLRVPGVTDAGMRTKALTSTTDFFPTLADIALGHTIPSCPRMYNSSDVMTCTEGKSLAPLLENPDMDNFSVSAFSTYSRAWQPVQKHSDDRKDHTDDPDNDSYGSTPTRSPCIFGKCTMGYTMLTNLDGHEVRYTEWVQFHGKSDGFAPAWDSLVAAEVYNHTVDAFENHNVFGAIRGTPAHEELQRRLHTGWPINLEEEGWGSEI